MALFQLIFVNGMLGSQVVILCFLQTTRKSWEVAEYAPTVMRSEKKIS